MAREIEKLGLGGSELHNQAVLLLNLGLNEDKAFASAIGHITGGENWDAGVEALVEKPFDDQLNFEVTGFVRGRW